MAPRGARWFADHDTESYVRKVANAQADLATCEEWRREHVVQSLGRTEELLGRWRAVVESLAP